MSTASPPTIPAATAADPFLALLTDFDAHGASQSTEAAALASLTADLAARNDESVQRAFDLLVSARTLLLARKSRVMGSAKRLFRKQCKEVVADVEAAGVSTRHLRVWAAVAVSGAAGLVYECCTLAASPLFTVPQLALTLATTIGLRYHTGLPSAGELGSLATGDGLRVLSAAGPGLKWFEPHSCNEFSVVLAQADGSVPVWLSRGDLALVVVSTCATVPAGAAGAAGQRSTVPVAVPVVHVELAAVVGAVSVVYACLPDGAAEVFLQLTVCGDFVADADGERDWGVLVRSSVGSRLVNTLAVAEGMKFGMAVSADDKWLVVGLERSGTLSVYALPGGELVRTISGVRGGPLHFNGLFRLCFAPNGNFIVVNANDRELKEVMLEGVFVRLIGVGEFEYGAPFSVAVHDDVIAVGCGRGAGPRVVLFDFGSGAVTSRFGVCGTAEGQLSVMCTGIRFTADGRHVIVAESPEDRLSLFTTAGAFVRCVGVGVLGPGCKDVALAVTGEFVVADNANHRVCVFSPDGSALVWSLGVRGDGEGQFQSPIALAAAGRHLYVMDSSGGECRCLSSWVNKMALLRIF